MAVVTRGPSSFAERGGARPLPARRQVPVDGAGRVDIVRPKRLNQVKYSAL